MNKQGWNLGVLVLGMEIN